MPSNSTGVGISVRGATGTGGAGAGAPVSPEAGLGAIDVERPPVEQAAVVLVGGIDLLALALGRRASEAVLEPAGVPGVLALGARRQEDALEPRDEARAAELELGLVAVVDSGHAVVGVVAGGGLEVLVERAAVHASAGDRGEGLPHLGVRSAICVGGLRRVGRRDRVARR